MLEEGLVALLYASEGVTSLIATNAIYPDMLPADSDLPAVTFHNLAGVPDQVMHISDGPGRLQQSRIQFSCWATHALTARKVAQAVALALVGYQGMLTDGDATWVDGIFADSSDAAFEDGPRYFRASLDVLVLYLGT